MLGDYIGGPRMEDPTGKCRFMHDYLLAEQDRVTGDYSSFWAARDYLGKVDRIRASVFVVHGLNDFNVKTKAFAEWWYRLAAERRRAQDLAAQRRPRRPGRRRRARPSPARAHRWFDHELFGVANGIDGEPMRDRPARGRHLQPGGELARAGHEQRDARARLALAHRAGHAVGQAPERRAADVHRPRPRARHGRRADQGAGPANPNRLVYRTAALSRDVRMSGTPWVTLRMSVDNRTAANLTAVLVDYGPDGSARMVTRGWLDPQNRNSLTRSDPVEPEQRYTMRWDLQPDDHVFATGHRIGLVVVSTDHDYTIRPAPGTRLTLAPNQSEISLPVVGGAGALR